MNFRKYMALLAISTLSTTALAGTLTIHAPPPGLQLFTTLGSLDAGDEPIVLTAKKHNVDIQLLDLAKGDLVGMASTLHNSTPEAYTRNQVRCRTDPGYSVAVTLIGYENINCSGNQAFLRQLGVEAEAADVDIRFM